LLAARTLKPVEATKSNFLSTLVETYRAMNPLIRFLNEPLLRDRQEKDRRNCFVLS